MTYIKGYSFPVALIDPRMECLLELEKEIKTQRELGSILMALEANDIRDATSDGYEDFANRLDIIPLMDLETAVPSRFGGNQVIDHMETYGISEQHMLCAGANCPKVLGFYLTTEEFSRTFTSRDYWD